MIPKFVERLRKLYREYPSQYWLVVGTALIDGTGRWLLFPFLAIYITNKFDVGLTSVGIVMMIFGLTAMVGGFVGGALTDRIGRKKVIVFALVSSALTNLLLGLAPTLGLLYAFAVVGGLFSSMGGPAHGAMVSDLLPPEKRAEGFGILRVVWNITVVIGPILGGLLATQSFMLLFIGDVIGSLITATIIATYLRETYTPQPQSEHAPRPGIRGTIASYRVVAKDTIFLVFVMAGVLTGLVYSQMYSTLSVYLHNVRGFAPSAYSLMLSMNALMVVLMQFSITRRVKKYTPTYMLALGCFLYAIGFGMYGVVTLYALYLVAMVIITIGEMIYIPVAQAFVASLAPEDARGRYMAIYGLSWEIPGALATLAAGVIIDNTRPEVLWYAAGICGLAATGAYVFLQRMIVAHHRVLIAPTPSTPPATAVASAGD